MIAVFERSFNKYKEYVGGKKEQFPYAYIALSAPENVLSFKIFNGSISAAYREKALLEHDILPVIIELICLMVKSNESVIFPKCWDYLIHTRFYPSKDEIDEIKRELTYFGLDSEVLRIFIKQLESNITKLDKEFEEKKQMFRPLLDAIDEKLQEKDKELIESKTSDELEQIDTSEANKLATDYYFLTQPEDVYRKNVIIMDWSIFNPLFIAQDENLVADFLWWYISLMCNIVGYCFPDRGITEESTSDTNDEPKNSISNGGRVERFFEFSKNSSDTYLQQHNKTLNKIIDDIFKENKWVPFAQDTPINTMDVIKKYQLLSAATNGINQNKKDKDRYSENARTIKETLIELGLEENYANMLYNKLISEIPHKAAEKKDSTIHVDYVPKGNRKIRMNMHLLSQKPLPLSIEDMEQYIRLQKELGESSDGFLKLQKQVLLNMIDEDCRNIAELKAIFQKFEPLFAYYFENFEVDDEKIAEYDICAGDIRCLPDILAIQSRQQLMNDCSLLLETMKPLLIRALNGLQLIDIQEFLVLQQPRL